MIFLATDLNAETILSFEIFDFFGRTIIAISFRQSNIIDLNADLHRRLNRFLCTAFPYFLDTEKPSPGVKQGVNLNDKSLTIRDFED